MCVLQFLRVHIVWKELLQDAEVRDCVVSVGVFVGVSA